MRERRARERGRELGRERERERESVRDHIISYYRSPLRPPYACCNNQLNYAAPLGVPRACAVRNPDNYTLRLFMIMVM